MALFETPAPAAAANNPGAAVEVESEFYTPVGANNSSSTR
jgi:hypothetical protein